MPLDWRTAWDMTIEELLRAYREVVSREPAGLFDNVSMEGAARGQA